MRYFCPMIQEAENSWEQEDEWFEHHRLVAPAGLTPVRIDKYIQLHIPAISRNKIQNGLRAAAIRVDDRPVKPNHKLRPGETVTILLPKPPVEGGPVKPEPIPLDIRYEDDDLMVVFKPAGLVVHPGVGNHGGTLANALAWHFNRTDMPVLPGNTPDRPGLVHRIDKDTSGLMLIAKNDFAMTHLARQFFEHTVTREYHAIVWGVPEPAQGVIHAWIGRDPKHRQQMTVFDEAEAGKEAITHYEVIEDLYYISLVKCTLETGRTHQIRVHMKHIGHPVFRDETYGGHMIRKGTVFTKYRQFVENCFALCPRQALHARTLGFEHPVTGERLFFEAPLPQDMHDVLEAWRHYLAHRKAAAGEE